MHIILEFLSCWHGFWLLGMWDHQFLTLDCQAQMSKRQSGCCHRHAPKSTAEGLTFIFGHSQVSNWNLWRSACTPYFGLTHCCTLITVLKSLVPEIQTPNHAESCRAVSIPMMMSTSTGCVKTLRQVHHHFQRKRRTIIALVSRIGYILMFDE